MKKRKASENSWILKTDNIRNNQLHIHDYHKSSISSYAIPSLSSTSFKSSSSLKDLSIFSSIFYALQSLETQTIGIVIAEASSWLIIGTGAEGSVTDGVLIPIPLFSLLFVRTHYIVFTLSKELRILLIHPILVINERSHTSMEETATRFAITAATSPMTNKEITILREMITIDILRILDVTKKEPNCATNKQS